MFFPTFDPLYGIVIQTNYVRLFLHLAVCISNRPHFLSVYQRKNPCRMLGEHEKNCVNHEPGAIKKKMGYFARYPKERAVFWFFKVNLKPNPLCSNFPRVWRCIKRSIFYLSECLWYLGYFVITSRFNDEMAFQFCFH